MSREPAITPDIFDDIITLIQNIPIVSGRFTGGMNIDTRFALQNTNYEGIAESLGLRKDSISFRDITNLFNKIIRDQRWNKMIFMQRYTQLRNTISSYPVEYLFFDFCIAALEGDDLDARLFLLHSYYVLGMSESFMLFLMTILNENLTRDKDVRKLLILLAKATQPPSAAAHSDQLGKGYQRRYNIYREELEKLK